MGNGIYFKIAGESSLGCLVSIYIVSGDAVHQPTWPLLLKIEHGKIAGFWVITQKPLIISEI
jgi:hypothetical protein